MRVEGVFKALVKLAFTTIILVFVADTLLIIGDRLLVEIRMWSIMEDMEEVAEENNGIPLVYIDHFEERLADVAERSYLISDIRHNMRGKITVDGTEYDSVGTYGNSPNSDVRVYNYGESMTVIVDVIFSYGSVVTSSIEQGREHDGEVTFETIARDGRGMAVTRNSLYERRPMASEVLK